MLIVSEQSQSKVISIHHLPESALRAAGGGGVVGFGGDAFGRQAFLKLAVMLRYKNGKPLLPVL